MKLVNFNFTKINVEKLVENTIEDIKINSKIDISEINVLETSAIKKDEGLIKVLFSYYLDYEPNIAKLDFKGRIVLVGDIKQIKEIEEKWKEKKMSEEFRILLFNLILRKVNVRALELEDEMRLPLHIPLPSIKPSK